MNIYDFDGTIYPGDSTMHFYLYCLRRFPRVARHWPALIAAAARHLRDGDKTALKQTFLRFLGDIPDIEGVVAGFWDAHIGRIKPWYLAKRSTDDLILSASPEFLLRPACERLGIKHLIATIADPRTGRIEGLNCRDREKVRRFEAVYSASQIDAFYSDSHADDPMAALAPRAYYVTGHDIAPWPAEKKSIKG